MRRHLKRWLNNTTLEALGDVYEGVVSTVTEETVRNRFSAQREPHPVVAFDDGWRWIPNMAARAALIELFGPETDAWVGRRVRVFRRREERMDRTTGEVRVRFVKSVECPDPHARAVVARTRPAVALAGDREWADYDDSDEAIAAARREP